MASEETCPDCGFVKAGPDTGLLETHCFAHRKYDWLGERICRDRTIARLRAELEALKAPVAWVATSERVPERANDSIWFWVSDGIGMLRHGYWTGTMFSNLSGFGWEPAEVSHWMPRPVQVTDAPPTPPKETDDAEG